MNNLKFVKFMDKFYNVKLINPSQVVSIEYHHNDHSVVLHLSNQSAVILDYEGVNEDKALWMVEEALLTGKSPYDQEEEEEILLVNPDADTEDPPFGSMFSRGTFN